MSILYRKKAGAEVPFFNRLDILAVPNPHNKEDTTFNGDTFSIHMFM